jgi:formate/nitrite transporter
MGERPGAGASLDAYTPAEMAARVRDAGVAKANLDLASLLALALLGGAFIALGAALSTLAIAGAELGLGPRRLVAGLAFSLGLILVIVAGAELFTGKNLVVMAWASRLVSTRSLLRSWFWVYLGNLAGALATALLIHWTAPWLTHGPQLGVSAVSIALAKCELGFARAFFLGVLANALVCLAVWLCFGARGTADRILAIVFPITAFVALGFEHSVANMYFIPMGMLLATQPAVLAAGGWSPEVLAPLSLAGFARNLAPVTLGNLVGGGLLVGAVYWFVYLRPGVRVR